MSWWRLGTITKDVEDESVHEMPIQTQLHDVSAQAQRTHDFRQAGEDVRYSVKENRSKFYYAIDWKQSDKLCKALREKTTTS